MATTTAKRNELIDILRFISSIFVLLIHCPLPGIIGTVIITIGRYAVPFFLMISGWYFYSVHREDMLRKAKKHLRNTANLMFVFACVYILLNSICRIVAQDPPLGWIKNYCNLKTLLYLFLFNRALFFGSTGYYVFMQFYVYITLVLSIKCNMHKYLLYVTPVLVVVNILLGEFTDLPWFAYGNFLFTGIPCFAIGFLLRKFEHKFICISAKTWGFIFVIGAASSYLEMLVTQAAYCHFGSIVMAVALLMFSLKKTYHIGNAHVRRAQRYSTIIFVIHCAIRDLLYVFFARFGVVCPKIIFPFIVIASSLLICVLFDALRKLVHK